MKTANNPHGFYTPPLIEVDWEDSYSSHGWETLEGRLREPGVVRYVKSVGYQLERNRRQIRLAESIGGSEQVGCTTTIPRFAVKGVRIIRPAQRG